jgi:hypothetical protein
MPCSSVLSYPEDGVRFHFIIKNSLFHNGNESVYLKKQENVPLMTVPSVHRKLILRSLNVTIQNAGYSEISPLSFSS